MPKQRTWQSQMSLPRSGELSLFVRVSLLKMICDGKIVGLKGSSNGRSCEQHACCSSLFATIGLASFFFLEKDGQRQKR